MLSQSKQNVQNCEGQKPTSSSTRRHSTYSTSACKKMLRSICEDSEINCSSIRDINLNANMNNSTSRIGAAFIASLGLQKQQPQTQLSANCSIKQLKYRQAISYLQKKNAKQMQQITVLTQDLNTLSKIRQQELKNIEEQMDRIRKNQIQKNQCNKVICELRKKVVQLQSQNTALKASNTDQDKKLTKLKQLLRKKQITLNQSMAKLEQQQSAHCQLSKQKQEISVLRQQFIKLKQKQSSLQEQNELIKAKLNQYKRQNCEMKGNQWGLEESNRRLTEQCEELEKLYHEARKEAELVGAGMQDSLEQQNKQIKRLRGIVERVQQIQTNNRNNQFCEVYKNQITQTLKQCISDKQIRAKTEKSIHEIVQSMEQAMNRILMQVIASHL